MKNTESRALSTVTEETRRKAYSAGLTTRGLIKSLEMIKQQTQDDEEMNSIVHNAIITVSGDRKPRRGTEVIEILMMIKRQAQGDEDFESIVHNAVLQYRA